MSNQSLNDEPIGGKKKDRLNEGTAYTVKVLLIAVICFVVILIIARFYLMRTKVDGSSMYPTLQDGEHMLIDKSAYRKHDPERFDIVVFETPLSDTGHYVKRIIALPGETIRIDDNGVIYINEEVLEEDYGYEQILDPGRARLGVTLGENEYFVMGDNRNHSEDSRFMLVGNISKDKILGKVIMRLWPLEKYGYIDLYMERTKDDNGQD